MATTIYSKRTTKWTKLSLIATHDQVDVLTNN